jgi:hypothetical protein
LKNRIDQHIRTNRRFTLDEIHEKFPQISSSLIHEIVMEHLHYKQICVRWVPQMLTEEHKSKCMGAALTFLERYHQEGDTFLDQTVTGDETPVCPDVLINPFSQALSDEGWSPRSFLIMNICPALIKHSTPLSQM